MDNLETGKDKIKKICEILRDETIEPAKLEAQKVLEQAQQKAEEIVAEGQKKASELLAAAKEQREKDQKLFKSSLKQASEQAMEGLRQNIEGKLFNEGLSDWVESHTADPKVAAALITALVQAIEKEGSSADFSALIPKAVPAEKVNAHLTKQILTKLHEEGMITGDFLGGVQIKMHDRKLTLDLSDTAIQELLEKYIRKEFHALLFQS
ncbi:MAG: V-type proton ATPase subunit E [Chlamydiae bacterium]|nr:V-type proton ATPase subunit E [Chlamydiota bacterium]